MRLLSLKQIQAEKLPRSRSWLFSRMAAGKFPKPLPNTVPGLWEEPAVDEAVAAYVAECKTREAEKPGAKRIEKAAEAKATKRREALAA